MAILNYLSEINPTSKIDVPDIVEMQKKANAFRELKTTRAIQAAKSAALKADGSFDQNVLRKSLETQGYGEAADDVINAMTSARQAQASTEATRRQEDRNLILQGLMDDAEYVRRHGGSTVTTQEPKTVDNPGQPLIVTGTNDQNAAAQLEAFKKKSTTLPENSVAVTGSVFSSKSPEQKLQDIPQASPERTLVESSPNVTPDYIASTVNPANFKSLGGFSADPQEAPRPAGIDVSGLDAETRKKMAIDLQRRGYPVADDKALQDVLTKQENDIIASVPRPIPVNIYLSGEKLSEDIGRFQKESLEYPTNVQKAINENRKNISEVYGIQQGEEIAKANLGISQKTLEETIEKNKLNASGLTPETNEYLSRKVQPSELTRLDDIRGGVLDMQDAINRINSVTDGNYVAPLYSFAGAVLKANNKPITEDAINTVLIGSGMIPKPDELILKKAIGSGTPLKDLLTLSAVKSLNIFPDGRKPNVNVLLAAIENSRKDFTSKGGNLKRLDEDLAPSKKTPEKPMSGAAKAVEDIKARGAKTKPTESKTHNDPLGIR